MQPEVRAEFVSCSDYCVTAVNRPEYEVSTPGPQTARRCHSSSVQATTGRDANHPNNGVYPALLSRNSCSVRRTALLRLSSMIMDAAGERSEQGRFLSNGPGNSNAVLGSARVRTGDMGNRIV